MSRRRLWLSVLLPPVGLLITAAVMVGNAVGTVLSGDEDMLG